ncbi:MAG: WD40 repeat domain-containing protein [Planctomycetaceae bacterium]
MKFSPDGGRVVWCGWPGEQGGPGIIVWNRDRNEVERRLPGHEQGYTYGVAFAPDGSRLVSCGKGKTIKVWDMATGGEVWSGNGHTALPWKVDWSLDGALIASCGSDGRVRLWNTENGEELAISRRSSFDKVIGVGFSADGQQILAGHDDGMLTQWTQDGALVRSFRFRSGDWPVFRHAFALSDSGRLAAVGSGAVVEVWDVATESQRWKAESLTPPTAFAFKEPATDDITFSPDERYVVTRSVDDDDSSSQHAVLRTWDVAAGALLAQVDVPRHVSHRPSFSPDGESFAIQTRASSPGGDRQFPGEVGIEVYETRTGRALRHFQSQQMHGSAFEWQPTARDLSPARRSRGELLECRHGRAGLHPAEAEPRNKLRVAGDHIGRPALAASSICGARDPCGTSPPDGSHTFLAGGLQTRFSPSGEMLLIGQDAGTVLVCKLAETTHVATPELSPRRSSALG